MALMLTLASLATTIAALSLAISYGILSVRLPSPADGFYVQLSDPDVFPWSPRPLEGEFMPNDYLKRVVRLFENQVHGSESVAVSKEGYLILLDKYGYLRVARPGVKSGISIPEEHFHLDPHPLVHLGPGRPLGAHFDSKQNLIVCDVLKGLVMVENGTHHLRLLSTRISKTSPKDAGLPIVYANDLDIAQDDTVYFSASQEIPVLRGPLNYWDTLESYMMGLASGTGTGRLLSFSPSSGETRVLANGLFYSNGVALTPDESFVAVVETNRIRVLRYWLKGDKAGTMDVLIDHLPGVPDGISRSSDGNFWLCLLHPVSPMTRLLKYPVIRALHAWLPRVLRPRVVKWGAVLKVSPKGEVLQTLMDPDGKKIAYISSVTEHDGHLYFGNLVGDYISAISLESIERMLQLASREALESHDEL